MYRRRPSGFTLIELSIVLVIIGLLIGGIVVGKSMIQAAELNAINRDVVRFASAVYAFRGKYNCMPGDCATAGKFWALKNSSDPFTCWVSGGGSLTTTCNGDGNDVVDSGYESAFFWSHLSLANVTAGQYGNYVGGQGWNSPRIPAFNGYYKMLNYSGSTWYWNGIAKGSEWVLNGSPSPEGPSFSTPVFARNVATQYDGKFDDGNLITGRIRSEWGAVAGTCSATVSCSLAILSGFEK
jgi:prepilin-type N-terminal cleavage/methylation domain-containing protein